MELKHKFILILKKPWKSCTVFRKTISMNFLKFSRVVFGNCFDTSVPWTFTDPRRQHSVCRILLCAQLCSWLLAAVVWIESLRWDWTSIQTWGLPLKSSESGEWGLLWSLISFHIRWSRQSSSVAPKHQHPPVLVPLLRQLASEKWGPPRGGALGKGPQEEGFLVCLFPPNHPYTPHSGTGWHCLYWTF